MSVANSHPRRAFTMIELVIVLMLIAIAVGLAAPSLRGWGQGAKVDDVARQFASVARWARAEAVASAETHRIEIDPATGAYTVKKFDGESFVNAAGEAGQPTALPVGITVQLLDVQGASEQNVIEFFANARSTPATVRITGAATGATAEVASEFPADVFRVRDAVGSTAAAGARR